ncbi:MAG: hypothetical protein PHP42_13205, partial [Bacteroidota bacterium]|nr:hypothetical protein [Bacteroidota bacterium]
MFKKGASLSIVIVPFLRRFSITALTAVACFLTYQQLQTDIYDFPNPKPFSGDSIYNPYAHVQGTWYKANFHAHTKAYSGLTYGTKSARYVIGKYKALDYDIINISDYFSMKNNSSDSDLFLDMYEHGLNIFKTHRLVIGAPSVDYFDFSFNFTLSNKQYVLHRLENECRLLAIAHPEFEDGHTRNDVKYLSGYQCMEVLNHLRTSTAHWDSALSAGKPVWLIAGDDSHSSSSILECGRTW